MEIKAEKNRFYVENEKQEKLAHISYQVESDDIIVANSTFVDPSLRGKGMAKKLLDRLAAYARENNLKIRPLCSYVVTAFERYEEYSDVKLEETAR